MRGGDWVASVYEPQKPNNFSVGLAHELTNEKVLETIGKLCREVIEEASDKAMRVIYNRNIVEIDTPLAMLYRKILESICDESQFIEKCTNTFAKAVQEAKEVLEWTFNGKKVWRCSEIPAEPWEKVKKE